MDNQQGDYDQNIAQEAGYTAGRFGMHSRPPPARLSFFIPSGNIS